MAFSEETVRWCFFQRANEMCECKRHNHNHSYVRCGKKLVWEKRGREGPGAWEAHHISATGGDGASNCEILCWECHRKTIGK